MTIFIALLVSGCASDADVASYNVSRAADNFEVTRRIVFYNGITSDYILVIEGLCSLGNSDHPRHRIQISNRQRKIAGTRNE